MTRRPPTPLTTTTIGGREYFIHALGPTNADAHPPASAACPVEPPCPAGQVSDPKQPSSASGGG